MASISYIPAFVQILELHQDVDFHISHFILSVSELERLGYETTEQSLEFS